MMKIKTLRKIVVLRDRLTAIGCFLVVLVLFGMCAGADSSCRDARSNGEAGDIMTYCA